MDPQPQEEMVLNLRQILFVVRKYYRLLLLIPCMALLLSYVAIGYLPQVYRAETSVLIMTQVPGQLTYTDLLLNKGLVKTYREIARSRGVLEEALRGLDTALRVSSLREMVDVTLKPETEIIVVAIESQDPVLAAELANVVAQSFRQQVSSLLGLENVAVIETAIPPEVPFKPQKVLIVALATFSGAMVALGAAFVLSHLDNTFKTVGELESCLRVTVLGLVPLHAACIVFEAAPTSPEGLE